MSNVKMENAPAGLLLFYFDILQFKGAQKIAGNATAVAPSQC